MPSVVAYKKERNEVLVGKAAINQAMNNLKNTLYDAKRILGHKYNDEKIQNNLPTWAFDLRAARGDKCRFHVESEG